MRYAKSLIENGMQSQKDYFSIARYYYYFFFKEESLISKKEYLNKAYDYVALVIEKIEKEAIASPLYKGCYDLYEDAVKLMNEYGVSKKINSEKKYSEVLSYLSPFVIGSPIAWIFYKFYNKQQERRQEERYQKIQKYDVISSHLCDLTNELLGSKWEYNLNEGIFYLPIKDLKKDFVYKPEASEFVPKFTLRS